MNKADNKDTVTPIVETGLDDMTDEQRAALAAQALAPEENARQERIVGYILAPEALVALLDICEDIPYRYSKKIVPTLQQSAQLIEGADGVARVVNN